MDIFLQLVKSVHVFPLLTLKIQNSKKSVVECGEKDFKKEKKKKILKGGGGGASKPS